MQIERTRLITAAQAARASMEENKVPGLAMAFFSGGEQVCAETLGIADSVCNLPVSMGTHFEAASLTKPVFAYLVLRPVEAGALRLDVPLCEYLAGSLPTEDPRFAQATAAHVLSHGTGLPNWGAAPLPLAFAPGQGFRYSGKGYTWRRLDDLLQTELFGPLGMEDAAMVWTGPLNRTLARTWDEAGAPEPKRRRAQHTVALEPNAAFSLYVTIADYPKFRPDRIPFLQPVLQMALRNP